MMRARFWIGWGWSDVRLSLEDGQSLTHGRSWATDEGWSSESVTIERYGDELRMGRGTDGRDCDGRLSTWHEYTATISGIRHGWPQWVHEDGGQRDEYAEAAGY